MDTNPVFSGYAESIEPIKITSEHNGRSRQTPSLDARDMVAEVEYLNACTGLSKTPEEQAALLTKMGLTVKPSSKSGFLDVAVPITRADILHQADIMEDFAIGKSNSTLGVSRTLTLQRAISTNCLGRTPTSRLP